MSETIRIADLVWLHPGAARRFRNLETTLKGAYTRGETRTLFLVFETYRTPMRQAWLKKTTRATKADAWQSTHQLGLAADFVPFVDGKWSWSDDEDWHFLDCAAAACGLVRPIRWDRPHIEHPLAGHILRECGALTKTITKDGEVHVDRLTTALSGWINDDQENGQTLG